MLKMRIFIILILLGLKMAASTSVRCFTGGFKIKKGWSKVSASELCLKDDLSQIKILVKHQKNDSGIYAFNEAWRKWTVSDWASCKPKKMELGPISLIDITEGFNLAFTTYACTRECNIALDKDNAEVIFTSDGVNHYEIAGTTFNNGWFKTSAKVKLDQTCEHVKATCGTKSMQFHACFKNHMACIRFLHGTMLPAIMATSICQNIELILMTTFTLIIFCILLLLMRTYICYLLMPLFLPFAYIYGVIYDKMCKKCKLCGLVYHPFTRCGTHCVCGSRFEGSEAMRKHREFGTCPGYKSTSTARSLCRSKGSAFSLSLMLAFLALGFITPIQGLELLNNNPPESINMLPEEFINMQSQINLYKTIALINASWTYALLIIATGFWFTFKRFQHKFLNYYAMYCKECDMYHERKGIKYNGDFTNKCGSCTCGEFQDMAGLTQHKKKYACIAKYKTRWAMNWIVAIIILCLVKDSMIPATAEETNLQKCISDEEIVEECTGPLLDLGFCNVHSKMSEIQIAENMRKKDFITELDMQIIELLGGNIAADLNIIDIEADPHRQRLLEYIFLKKHCDYYLTYEQPSSYSQIIWHYFLKNNQTNICKEKPNTKVCKCLHADSNKNCNSKINDAQDYYKNKSNELEKDFQLYMRLFKSAFPGTATTYLINLTMSNNIERIRHFLVNISNKYPGNHKLQAFMQLGLAILENSTQLRLPSDIPTIKPEPLENLAAKVGETTAMLKDNFDQKTEHAQITCENPKELVCISPKTKIQSKPLVYCLYKGKFQLIDTGYKLYKLSGNSPNTYCIADTYCTVRYRLATQQKIDELFKNRCWNRNYVEPRDYPASGRTMCEIVARGMCTRFGSIRLKVVLCKNGMYFPDFDGPVPHNADNPSLVCLKKSCQIESFPFDMGSITNCTWDNPRITPIRVKESIHTNFEEYKESLLKKIQTDMAINKFKLVANLPFFLPRYEYLSLKGVETSDGIDNSYIYLELPALTGTSVGIKVLAPNGRELLDVIVYIKSSKVVSKYTYQYYTGQTIAINTEHTEHCTGACPNVIDHKPGWATFSKERSSNWGCEEFGCLAIQTGCVFGSCQDVIRRDYEIYSKAEDDSTITNVCISISNKAYCTEVESTSPILTSDIELQYKTVEANILPKMIAMKDHRLYRGQINEKGSFGRYCGNLQVWENQTIGQADVRFDYICYAAARKDVIVRKCLNNDAQSCKTLKHDTDLIFEENNKQVTVYNNKKLTGSVGIKVMLGDFNYKQYKEDFTAEFEINCAGCYSCLDGIICHVKVRSELGATCEILAPCPTFIKRLVINPGESEHAIKLDCSTSPDTSDIEFKICQSTVMGHLTISQAHDNIQLSTGEQSTYIHEEDLRCQTWLCKVKEEGLSFIFKPLIDWLRSFTWPIFVIIGIIIAFFVVIYIFMPMCMKLRDILKKNEYQHMQEIKAVHKTAKAEVKYKKSDDKIKLLAFKPID
ncbi:polyprotein [Botambi virus]|uniref:Envelopment polyprotein n=1 Tax=Botambi virus TaxID=2849744 RepID=A0AAX3JJ95_9VIRU|nr:polyprotein [Botambi virus]WAD86870.1 polyprotein [Botambi virus]